MASNHTYCRSKPAPTQVPINLRWCNRALRPLTSIYLRLEKHWKVSPLRDEEYIRRAYNGGTTASNGSQGLRRTAPGSANASDSESSKEDPTWVPGDAVRKPIKHRYSGRRERPRTNGRSKVVVKSPEAEKLQPGQFTIATPLILGKRRVLDLGKTPAAEDIRNVEKEPPQKQKLFSYSKHKSLGNSWSLSEIAHGIEDTYNDPSYVAIVQTIFSAWDTFLRMSSPQQSHGRGAKSLLSMALNTTSEYILHEQERVNSLEEKEEEIDVAGFIITELEKTYAMSSDGWKPLKELVRSHGIHLMCEAIRKRWLSPQLSRRIVLQSFALSAHDAAGALLSALLSLSPIIPPPIRLDSDLFKPSHSVALHTLETYVRSSGNLSIFFREMASLLDRGRLPAEWLATDSMKNYLTAALQSLSTGDEHSFASLRLITSAILAAAGSKRTISPKVLKSLRRSKRGTLQCLKGEREPSFASSLPGRETNCHDPISIALSNSITSILTVLSASHFAKFGFAMAKGSAMYKLLTFLSTIVQRDVEQAAFDGKKHKLDLQPTRACAILLSDFLINYLDSCGKGVRKKAVHHGLPVIHNLGYLTGMHKNKKELVEELSAFVLQIAKCLGRVQSDDGFEVAKLFTLAFECSDVKGEPILRRVLSKVAVEIALKFAESTCLQDHHDWASYIQDQVVACDVNLNDSDELQPLTPSLRRSATGFRWEDGIGEWVAKTPVFSQAKTSRSASPLPNNTASQAAQPGNYSNRTEISDSEESDSWFSSVLERNTESSSVSSDYSESPPPPKRKRLSSHTEDHRSRRPNNMLPNKVELHNPRRSQQQAPIHWNPDMDTLSGSESQRCRRSSRRKSPQSHVSNMASSFPSLYQQRSNGELVATAERDTSQRVAVVVEVPRLPKVPTVEVVIFKEKVHDINRKKRRHTEPLGVRTKDLDISEYEEDEDEQEDDDDDEEEDILSHAPALSQRLRQRIPRYATSRLPISRLKMSRNPHPRRSMRLSLGQREIPCSDGSGSSDDELSFC
ncbi:uncharacterized protein GIQ15_01102 [Arthroderma uncinatum]|uniref:uncharacterized protein n=1 Tax=Arthroderma uncinatum TaxID=74035 RepID=UPI00144A92DF|nr:uncharacterized protein GIQ15_01102 [Arthroderma uncinatum]KAF3491585.1 hypothetical protein GIQ15_01102 [Arthroderma uncinatum]